jgi:hypothetical protein
LCGRVRAKLCRSSAQRGHYPAAASTAAARASAQGQSMEGTALRPKLEHGHRPNACQLRIAPCFVDGIGRGSALWGSGGQSGRGQTRLSPRHRVLAPAAAAAAAASPSPEAIGEA